MFTLQQLLDAGLPAVSTDGNGTEAETIFTRTLTPTEWQTYLSIADPSRVRQEAAEDAVRNIPGWATWSEAEALDWWNTNLSDAQVDAVANLADAKVILKRQNAAIRAMARMLIAMRDRLWPGLADE